jgi:hypothetical protein
MEAGILSQERPTRRTRGWHHSGQAAADGLCGPRGALFADAQVHLSAEPLRQAGEGVSRTEGGAQVSHGQLECSVRGRLLAPAWRTRPRVR